MRKSAYQSSSDQSKILFLGKGDGTFEEVTERTGKTFQYKRMGRGAAFADLDLDGRMDIVVSNKNQPAQVLLNRIPPKGHWLELKLRGRRPNPFAVGARARVHAGGKCLTREVYAGTSYMCGDDGILHFGLGSAAAVDRIEVRWPGGRTETYPGGPADILMTIEDRGPANPVPQIVPASVPAADPVPAVPPAILSPAAPAGDSPGGGPADGAPESAGSGRNG
jgi:hypothetical protein